MRPVRLQGNGLDELSEEERRALRASKFASGSSNAGGSSQAVEPRESRKPPRIAHPGGAIATNKAHALLRFLHRKQAAGEVANLDPELVEMAVRNVQASLAPEASEQKVQIRHVEAFDDPEIDDEELQKPVKKMRKRRRKKQANQGGGSIQGGGKKGKFGK